MRPLAEQTIVNRENEQNEDFPLVPGGPLYQLPLRFRLVQPPLGHAMSHTAGVKFVNGIQLLEPLTRTRGSWTVFSFEFR